MFNARLPVSGTSVTVTFPVNVFFSTPPIIHVTIEGAPTEVSITRNSEEIGGHGFVYTSVTLGFQSGAVGKTFNISVIPE